MSSNSSSHWRALCAARKQQQLEQIPHQWTLQLPPEDQRNVMNIPRTTGLLTPRELEITETVNVEIILHKLAIAEWSSVEVTTAFYKRAIIAHQLVCPPSSSHVRTCQFISTYICCRQIA